MSFSHSQYETLAKSSLDESRNPNRLRDKMDLIGHQRNRWPGGILLEYKGKRNMMSSSQPFGEVKMDDSSNSSRKNSASENVCSSGCKPPRQFVSNKVVLELRSHLKPPPQYSDSPLEHLRSNDWKNNSVNLAVPRKCSSGLTEYSSTVDHTSLDGRGSRAVCGVKFGNILESSNPPTKIMLQLCSRASHPSNLSHTSIDSLQHKHDRPAYARRFILARPENDRSVLSPPVRDGYGTGHLVDPNLRKLSQFVLPPLPLGLRPLSPEPRNLLLNAPKKV
ncbi:hypothetical protein DICVIV_09898 [Dictyocaulus viviparus]|uniref:Uncharacterized protein n=1 Tax=Dictyocaulus viviparus TaxID=29172 RepID=A0A0D8XHJ4_DICVI|nr:hypothetical protein DICVIV_09898 [Dictyocaulus viviparus]